MTASRKLLAASGATAGAFDPETDITWHSLFWAEGTDFVAQGYSDTDSVTTWPNETAESNLANTTGTTTYVVSAATVNSQPAVSFVNGRFATSSFTTAPDYTSGVSYVLIGELTDALTAQTRQLITGINGVTDRNLVSHNSGTYRIYAGTVVDAGTVNGNLNLFVAKFTNSTSDTLIINGTTIISGSNAGAEEINGLTLGSTWHGHFAFAGIYEGDITADGSWADFEAWVTDHYGITIA